MSNQTSETGSGVAACYTSTPRTALTRACLSSTRQLPICRQPFPYPIAKELPVTRARSQEAPVKPGGGVPTAGTGYSSRWERMLLRIVGGQTENCPDLLIRPCLA